MSAAQRPIAIIASGTRGDLQPALALGIGLRAAGHAVRVIAHPRFAPLAGAYNLPFAPLAGDQHELFGRADLRAALRSDAGPLRSAAATLRYLKAARPLYAAMLTSAWEAAQGAGAIVVGLPTHWADQIARALGVPCIWGLAQPAGRTAIFPSPLLPIPRSLGAHANRLTHTIVEYAAWLPWRDLLARWQRDTLRLQRPPAIGWPKRTAADLLLYAFSPQVVPPPPDWPPRAHVTGYWFLPPDAGYTPPADLAAWIAAGERTIYLGFGGMSVHADAEWPARLALALAEQGRRVVLAAPGAAPHPNIFPIGDISHDWLFPQLAAAIHHGGAGTTATALRAGIPSICVPFGVDQHYWGGRVAALGCGPAPLPQRSLTAARLISAVAHVVAEPHYAATAAALGVQIRSEDGVARAVELIELLLRLPTD
jgi:sterol 3beta-glucosyltransferase